VIFFFVYFKPPTSHPPPAGAAHSGADAGGCGARPAAAGHEAILVSHQLPIVMVQRTVLGQRLPHAPWNRECDLASVTSLLFEDNQVTDIFYSSPAQEI